MWLGIVIFMLYCSLVPRFLSFLYYFCLYIFIYLFSQNFASGLDSNDLLRVILQNWIYSFHFCFINLSFFITYQIVVCCGFCQQLQIRLKSYSKPKNCIFKYINLLVFLMIFQFISYEIVYIKFVACKIGKYIFLHTFGMIKIL